MLTPAEEMGLSGRNLAARVRRAFFHQEPAALSELLERVREESARRHVVYLRDGSTEIVRLLPCPLTALPDQVAYLHFVSLTVQNALKRLPELYMKNFAVREILRITPAEEQWLWECWGPSHQETNPVFGRLDAVVDFTSPMWKETLWFMEPNMSGIGGLHLAPMSERIVAELVFPLLQQRDPLLKLESAPDVRELLMQEVLDHLDALGHRGATNLCFIEPKYAASGIDEQEDVARFLHERYGLKIMHADPAELEIVNNAVVYRGDRVDIAYRDYSVIDLIGLQKTDVNVEPIRTLLRQNRMVSSIAAELDQKACWEIFSDPDLSPGLFTPEERQLFRRHILWTRVLSDRETRLPDGQTASLLDYVRNDRETLVIKPNRAYGGEGVTIGLAASPADWDAAIERALLPGERWVVQRLANIPVSEFPVVSDDGTVHIEPFYTVLGFAPSKYGLAMMGRASQKQVVNVAQRGGMCVVALGHPPGRLLGPGR